MIQRIRRKFILIAMAVLSGTILFLAAVINLSNWVSVRSELAGMLDSLSERSPLLSSVPPEDSALRPRPFRTDSSRFQRNRSRMMQARIDESRFFSVAVAKDGTCKLSTVVRESAYTEAELEELAGKVIRSGRTEGFSEGFRFRITENGDGTRTGLFLNCSTRLQSVRSLAWISAAACLGGILIAWFLVSRLSWRAIRPMAENALQQQRFITDAGHELKTPLTVINANMDLLASEKGDSEWIRSTRRQVSGMQGLVQELIDLSRMDEFSAELEMCEFDLSRAVRDAADPFSGMAEFSGKSLELSVPDGIRFYGNEPAMRRLVSVLLDNAVKYSPEGDRIRLVLSREGKKAVLLTENRSVSPLPEEAVSRLFDRFYRPDASRTRDGSGGSGIGLSIARAIAEKHGGQIHVRQDRDGTIRFQAEFPGRIRIPAGKAPESIG